MKFKSLLVVALAAAVPALACAKKPKTPAAPAAAEAAPVVEEEEPTITEECVVNVSLFHESVKNKMYADAYENIFLLSMNIYSSLAQSVEHSAVNRSVVGSSPTGGAQYQS